MTQKPKAVVLLSGGLDSTTILALAKQSGFEPYAISFRYGQRHEVEVLYLGLNQAWYVDPSDRFSGQGIPGAEGWTWKQDNRLASSVRSAIEVQTRRAVPTFVELPLANGKEATK